MPDEVRRRVPIDLFDVRTIARLRGFEVSQIDTPMNVRTNVRARILTVRISEGAEYVVIHFHNITINEHWSGIEGRSPHGPMVSTSLMAKAVDFVRHVRWDVGWEGQ